MYLARATALTFLTAGQVWEGTNFFLDRRGVLTTRHIDRVVTGRVYFRRVPGGHLYECSVSEFHTWAFYRDAKLVQAERLVEVKLDFNPPPLPEPVIEEVAITIPVIKRGPRGPYKPRQPKVQEAPEAVEAIVEIVQVVTQEPEAPSAKPPAKRRERLFYVDEVAEAVGRSTSWVYKWIDQGRTKAEGIDNRWRVPRSEVKALMAAIAGPAGQDS